MLVEPLAGGIHAALHGRPVDAVGDAAEPVVAVLGAGTMGLAADRRPRPLRAARHASSSAPATRTSSASPASSAPTTSCRPAELARAVRRIVGCHVVGDHLSSGAHATIDAVGTERSIARRPAPSPGPAGAS